MSKKPLEIDMCAGSQLRDTQGEMLSVEGADITEMEEGRGKLNDNHGKGFFNSVGRVTLAKKIFKEEDCGDDERQKYYWNKVKCPYIYVKGILYDDEDHPNAKATAAILRNIHKADCPLKLKASVEGGTIARGIKDPSLLARTKIHSVALTFTPANNATLVEPLGLEKSTHNQAADYALIKSVMHLAKTDIPSFRHITRNAQADKIADNFKKIQELANQIGLKTSVAKVTPNELIQSVLEKKITDNIAKINELIKGSRQRKQKFDPNTYDLEDRRRTHAWVSGGLGDYMQTDIPRLEDNARLRALHKLSGRTQTRMNPETKEREFLLHRGVTPNDAHSSIVDDHYHNNYKDHNSWTWDPKVADDFANQTHSKSSLHPDSPFLPGQRISAWVPEKHIQHMPSMIGHPVEHEELFDDKYKKSKDLPKITGKRDDLFQEKEVVANSTPMKIHSINGIPLKKALTAGYGGGGEPSSRTNGAVIQTEKMDNIRDGTFKYITCDKCGKEQPHLKHQVKCRDCNESFPLEKLFHFLKSLN